MKYIGVISIVIGPAENDKINEILCAIMDTAKDRLKEQDVPVQEIISKMVPERQKADTDD